MSTPDTSRPIPVKELIEQYNRELMETYRQQSQPHKNWLDEEFPLPDIVKDRQRLIATPAQGNVSPPPDSAPQPAGTETAPQPGTLPSPAFPYTDADLHGEVPIPPPPVAQTPAPAESLTPKPFEGYLRVFVFTGQTAEPLPGARITVSRDTDSGSVLYANTVTNRDGLTPVIVLPSVDPAQTMQPGAFQPYVLYSIRVNADGFVTAIYEDIPVYGGNSVTQSAGMYPLIPGAENSPLVFRSGGPANL